MKISGEIPNKQMAIWFPVDFWRIVGNQMKISTEFVQNLTNNMDDYLLFAVVDYTISKNGGGITFKSDYEIRNTIKFIDSAKTIYLPLKESEFSEETNRMIETLKPIMKNLLGQFGEGMQLFLFKTKKDKKGGNSILIQKENNLNLQWNNVSLKWKLPFASVLALKYCPIDIEEMKGNWNYCPTHGKKLE
jgi:hypothetical protein